MVLQLSGVLTRYILSVCYAESSIERFYDREPNPGDLSRRWKHITSENTSRINVYRAFDRRLLLPEALPRLWLFNTTVFGRS